MSDFYPDLFNAANPIVGIEVFGKGVIVVHRKSLLKGECMAPEGRKDKKIMRFTGKSMSRLVATVNATEIKFRSMITLTYPSVFPRGGQIIKENMNTLLTMFRDAKYGEYLWFLEFQERGAPHFHILLEVGCITPRMRVTLTEKWCSTMSKGNWFSAECEGLSIRTGTCVWDVWQRAVRKSFWFTMRSETWEVLKREDGGKRYATTYAAKEYQKEAPEGFKDVGRFWGCSKGVSLAGGEFFEMDENRLRMYLLSEEHTTSKWDVLPKYLFNVTGERKDPKSPSNDVSY